MGQRRNVAILIGLIAAGVLVSNAMAAGTHPRVLVFPAQAHAGDIVYVSGSGFPANAALSAGVTCYSRQPRALGISAGSRGTYAAIGLGLPSNIPTGQGCKIRVAAGNTLAEAALTIVPRSKPLAPCATHICLKAHGYLAHIASGTYGHVQIQGWPGAQTDIMVSRPGFVKHQRVQLNWEGIGNYKVWVAPGLIQGLKTQISARAWLGQVSGSTTGKFIVLPGR